MLFLVSAAVASSAFQNSDNYGGSVPKEFEKDSIVFTTPALQNMARAHFSLEEALRLIKLHQKESCFTEGLSTFMLSGNRLVSFFQK